MIPNFRLRMFRYVLITSISARAAQDLLLDATAVKQQIKALEDDLGVSLFDRAGSRSPLPEKPCCHKPRN
jgi:DNA-binding transcriptional LysR family regulator